MLSEFLQSEIMQELSLVQKIPITPIADKTIKYSLHIWRVVSHLFRLLLKERTSD